MLHNKFSKIKKTAKENFDHNTDAASTTEELQHNMRDFKIKWTLDHGMHYYITCSHKSFCHGIQIRKKEEKKYLCIFPSEILHAFTRKRCTLGCTQC